jgi:branched-chain amino acid transport system permease protein
VEKRRERIDRGVKARAVGIFTLWSWKEMMFVSGPRLFIILTLAFLPLILDDYLRKVLLSVAVYALLGISWSLMAQGGMISLGQSLFFGIGSYLSGIMNHYWGWPVYFTIPIATLWGGVLGTLILLPTLRLRGVYFAMLTLMVPLITIRIIEATKIFGGTEGLHGLSSFGSVSELSLLCLMLAALVVSLFGCMRLIDSNFGLVIKAIHDNDQSVVSSGIYLNWYKAQILFIASCMGAFCGAFMTHVYRFVGMSAFSLDYCIMPLAATVVGGFGNFAGSVLGAFIIVPISEFLRGVGGLRIAFYGLFLVIFSITLPEGLFNFLERKYNQFEHYVVVEK